MFTNATNKFWSLFITCLADVDGLKKCIQVCVLLGFRPLRDSCERSIKRYSWEEEIGGGMGGG